MGQQSTVHDYGLTNPIAMGLLPGEDDEETPDVPGLYGPVALSPKRLRRVLRGPLHKRRE